MRVALALLLFATTICQAADEVVPLGPLPRSVTPERYALTLRMDPDEAGFTGEIAIDVAVHVAVDTIWLHGRDLDIAQATLVTAQGETMPLETHVADADAGVLRLRAPATLAPGKAQLRLRYAAKYDQQLQGAYQIEAGGRRYVATQMQPLGARGAFPAFDEPAFKTPWDMTLVVPKGQVAVANAAEIAREPAGNGWERVRFATTAALPTYLVAFAVGPWDIVAWDDIPPNAIRKTPLALRGIAPKGRGAELRYALMHTAEQVAALERYFALPYPFDKLDLLAAPDFSFGAMENAGLIVYHESLLLGIDKAPTALRQAYWATHTHELAHQWFGNLVTMPWWDDLWLNESFATWMEARMLRELRPEFRVDQDLLEAGLEAMRDDSLASARRIHNPVHDYTEVLSAFDGITYSKGAAVLAMFERFVGVDAFRDAIRTHLRRFAGGTATGADLMRSVAAASSDASRVQAAFASFTDRAGVPLLRAELRCGTGRPSVRLQQQRYLPLGSTAASEQRWGLPVCVRYARGGGSERTCTLLADAQADLPLDAEAGHCPAWLHPNADGAGYYRFALSSNDQPALARAFPSLGAAEQRTYADSLVAAYDSGLLTTAEFLAALPALAAARDHRVALAPQATLAWIREQLARTPPQRDAFDRLVVAAYLPRLDAIGLDPGTDDDDERLLLREGLIALLAPLPPARTLRDALAARGRAMLAPAGEDAQLALDAVPSDQHGIALKLAAELGGAREFEAMRHHLVTTQDALLRRYLLSALGSFRDPALADRARALALSGTLRAGEVAWVPIAQMDVPALRDSTRAWFQTNFERLLDAVPQAWRAYLPTFEAEGLCSAADADALAARYTARMGRIEGGPLALRQAVEEVRLCAAKRRHHTPAGFGEALSAFMP